MTRGGDEDRTDYRTLSDSGLECLGDLWIWVRDGEGRGVENEEACPRLPEEVGLRKGAEILSVWTAVGASGPLRLAVDASTFGANPWTPSLASPIPATPATPNGLSWSCCGLHRCRRVPLGPPRSPRGPQCHLLSPEHRLCVVRFAS